MTVLDTREVLTAPVLRGHYRPSAARRSYRAPQSRRRPGGAPLHYRGPGALYVVAMSEEGLPRSYGEAAPFRPAAPDPLLHRALPVAKEVAHYGGGSSAQRDLIAGVTVAAQGAHLPLPGRIGQRLLEGKAVRLAARAGAGVEADPSAEIGRASRRERVLVLV